MGFRGPSLRGNYSPGSVAMVYSATLGSPIAVSATNVHAAITSPASGTTVVTTGITNTALAAVSRNVTAKGSASGMTGNVVIAGTNVQGNVITETIALSGASEVAGNKAFASVTSITIPAKVNGSGDTVSIGIGAKLGLGCMFLRDTLIGAYFGNVAETIAAKAFSSTVLESNTITLTSTLDASAVVVMFYYPHS